MARNMLSALEKRQCSVFSPAKQNAIVGCLGRRTVHLTDIADHNREILNGHVLLGFSRCGGYLISYVCVMTNAPSTAKYDYSLHLWTFDQFRPLTLAHSYELFQEEVLPYELHLVISQPGDERFIVVIGCRRSSSEDMHRPCYVTVLQREPQEYSEYLSINIKFDLLPPFPSFIPALCLKIPGCVILNTGDSLVCVKYSLDCTTQDSVTSSFDDPSPNNAFSYMHKCYTEGYSVQGSSPIIAGTSPSSLLPVDVFCGESSLFPVPPSAQCRSLVEIHQSRLDVEIWLNSTLPPQLFNRGFTFLSLNDYDIQLVEVYAQLKEVIFAMSVLVEVKKMSSPDHDLCTLSLLASWNTDRGIASCLKVSAVTLLPPVATVSSVASVWHSATELSQEIRKESSLPLARHATVRAFSNHSVYTGKSLQALTHPYLPIILRCNK